MRATRCAAALAALAMFLAGCSGELVGGGQRDVDARATGDGTSSGSPSLSPRFSLADGGTAFQANGISGTISFDAKVVLMRGGSAELIGTGASRVVAANGSDTVQVASASVAAVEYPTARVTFTRVQANVASGLSIGGINVTGQVNVAIADSVVVEMPVDLGDADEDATLLIDLDASAWLAAANPATRVVSSTAFRGAVKLRRAD
jgi:hypothetical protein